jgi:hypothetical protein
MHLITNFTTLPDSFFQFDIFFVSFLTRTIKNSKKNPPREFSGEMRVKWVRKFTVIFHNFTNKIDKMPLLCQNVLIKVVYLAVLKHIVKTRTRKIQISSRESHLSLKKTQKMAYAGTQSCSALHGLIGKIRYMHQNVGVSVFYKKKLKLWWEISIWVS